MDTTRFQGVVVPIVTPCTEQDGVDEDALTAFASRLEKAPIRGLYINGGTGDGGSLTREERERTVEILLPELKKPAGAPSCTWDRPRPGRLQPWRNTP